MSVIHLRSESGAVLYFDVAALPGGIADRMRRGNLVRVTEDGEPWDESAAAEGAPDSADAIARERDELRARVAELEAQLAALGDTGREPGDADKADDESSETPDDDGEPADGEPDGEPPPGPSDAPPLPGVRENRGVWTEFAIGQGMDRGEANSLTKAQLIERLTTAPPAP